jgi:hypothetical protein
MISEQQMSTLVVLIAGVVAAAAVLSVTQASAAGPSRHRAFRYTLAALVSTTALTLTMLFLSGFRGEIPAPPHRNVAWSALGLAALTTAVVFAVGNRRRSTSHAPDGALWQRTWACLPANIWLVAGLGVVDMFILTLVFLGNIH